MKSPVKQLNFPLSPQPDECVAKKEILNAVEIALNHTQNKVKMGLWLGGALGHFEEGNIVGASIFHPGYNTNIIPRDEVTGSDLLLVEDREEGLEKVKVILDEAELVTVMSQDRPDTKSRFLFFTNVRVIMYTLTDALIGQEVAGEKGDEEVDFCIPKLPMWVKEKKSLKNINARDKLCLFHCIRSKVKVKKQYPSIDSMVKKFVEYRSKLGFKKPTVENIHEKGLNYFSWGDGMVNADMCQGNTNSLIGQLEQCFGLNINIFYLDEETANAALSNAKNTKREVNLTPIHVCRRHGKVTLNVLLDGQSAETCHAWVITNMKAFSKWYKCPDCFQRFKRCDVYRSHVDSGNCLYRYIWPGGKYERSRSVWEDLNDLNVPILQKMCRADEKYVDNDACITFDIETNTAPLHCPNKGIDSECYPMSMSYSVKMDGEAPSSAVHIRDDDPEVILKTAYSDWQMQQLKAEANWHNRMEDIYLWLEIQIIKNGGTVKTTEDRYERLTPQYREALKYLSFTARTEKERTAAFHTLSAPSKTYEAPKTCKRCKARSESPFLHDVIDMASEVKKLFTKAHSHAWCVERGIDFNYKCGSDLQIESKEQYENIVYFLTRSCVSVIHKDSENITSKTMADFMDIVSKYQVAPEIEPQSPKEIPENLNNELGTLWTEIQQVIEYGEAHLPVHMQRRLLRSAVTHKALNFKKLNAKESKIQECVSKGTNEQYCDDGFEVEQGEEDIGQEFSGQRAGTETETMDVDYEEDMDQDVDHLTRDYLGGGTGDGIQDIGESTGLGDGLLGSDDGPRVGGKRKKKKKKKKAQKTLTTPRGRKVKTLSTLLYKVKEYGSSLPVVGYNSSRFDIPAFSDVWPKVFEMYDSSYFKEEREEYMKANNIPVMRENQKGQVSVNPNYCTFLCKEDKVFYNASVINPSNKYTHIMTPHGLVFRDLVLFVSPGTSLAKLGQSYKVPMSKMLFPYSVLKRGSDISALKAELTRECYGWFTNRLRKPYHRIEGNLLEDEWSKGVQGFRVKELRAHITVQEGPEFWYPFDDEYYCDEMSREYNKEYEVQKNPFSLNQKQVYALWDHIMQCECSFDATQDYMECLGLPKDHYIYGLREWVEIMAGWVKRYNRWYDSTSEDVPQKPSSVPAEGLDFPFELAAEVDDYLRHPDREKQSSWEYEDSYKLKGIVTGVESFDKSFIAEYNSLGCPDMGDYLRHYNNVDVEIMHPIISLMREKWRSLDPLLMLFRNSMSLPNLSRNFGFKEAEKAGGFFHLCKGEEEGEKLERTLRRNVVGGPSIIYNRHFKAGETILPNGKPVAKIVTYDGNSLYPFALSQAMPTGQVAYMYEMDEESKEWKLNELGKTQDSVGEKVWIKKCQKDLSDTQSINTRETFGKVIRLGPYTLDGARFGKGLSDQEVKYGIENLAYEYCGDYWHGNPLVIEQKTNPEEVVKLQRRLVKTLIKFVHLLQRGYSVFWTWEKDFKDRLDSTEWEEYNSHYPNFTARYKAANKKEKASLLRWLTDPFHLTIELTRDYSSHDEARTMSLDEKSLYFYGFIEVDLEPPGELDTIEARQRAALEKFEPLFVRGRRFCEEKPSLYPALSKVVKVLIGTPYLRFLLSKGYSVTKVYRLVEYKAQKCFGSFISKVVKLRRQGDSGQGDPLLTEVAKLVANSFYGSSLLNKDKHGKVHFVKKWFEVCKAINRRNFMKADMLNKDLFQVTNCPFKINQNIPIQVGKMVLDLAKWHMGQFYYSILLPFLQEGSFALGSMDTDSFTFAISEDTLDQCVKPELKDEWDTEIKPLWFANCDSDCSHTMCSKRTPGPFKKEFEGVEFVGLSSKMYTVRGEKPGDPCKVASKGLRKNCMPSDPTTHFLATLPENGSIPMKVDYSSMVMYNKDIGEVNNAKGVKRVMTIQNNSRTVTCKYSKREVQADGTTKSVRETVYCSTPHKERKVRQVRVKKLKAAKEKLAASRETNTIPSPPNTPPQSPQQGIELSFQVCSSSHIEEKRQAALAKRQLAWERDNL